VFPTEAAASEGLEALELFHRDRKIKLHGTLIIEQQADGSIATKRASEGPLRRTGIGTVVGAVVGVVVGGPVGVFFGAGIGAFLGGVDDAVRWRVREAVVDDVARRLAPGRFAVVADMNEEKMGAIDTRMADLGGEVIRAKRRTVVDTLVNTQSRAHRTRVAEDEAARVSEDAESRELIFESEVQDLRADMRWTSEAARSQLEDTRQKLDHRIRSLDEEIAAASPPLRRELEKRMIEIKRDLSEREATLARALELADEALRR
jgi:uncharacterized membrane protein